MSVGDFPYAGTDLGGSGGSGPLLSKWSKKGRQILFWIRDRARTAIGRAEGVVSYRSQSERYDLAERVFVALRD